jgi:hypothetical protein
VLDGHSYGCPFGPPESLKLQQPQRLRSGPNGQPNENSQLDHPSKLPLRLEAQPGNAGCAVVRFGLTRSENDA